MTYESKALQFNKEHIYVVEVELDYCSNTFASAPCTASGSGDAKCFNTFGSCQDLPNYTGTELVSTATTMSASAAADGFTRSSGSFITDGFQVGHKIITSGFTNAVNNGTFTVDEVLAGAINVSDGTAIVDEAGDGDEKLGVVATKTYRFCEDRSPHPIGIDAIPSLDNISIAPAKINVAGGMGERSSVSMSFKDHPHSDIDIDQYVSERTWSASERGQYWTKLRARNPNYQFRPVRVLTGYLEGNKYLAENFKTRNYVIDKLDVTAGKANITGKDPLKRASVKKAQVPTPNTGTLLADIDAVVLSATLTPAGIGNTEYAASGFIAIGGNEVCDFTRAGDVLTITTRGDKGTTASAHSAGDIIQQCYVQNAEVNIIAKDLLTNFANINADFINDAAWQLEVDTYLNGLLDGIITKPTDVFKVFTELTEAKPFFVYWDELNQLINFTALKAPPETSNVIDMDSGIVSNSFRTKDLIKLRASTVNVTFGQIDPTKSLTELDNYTQTVTRADTDSISKYDTNQIKNIVSRWINSGNKPAAQNAAQLVGRRFADIPREVNFSLEAKDSSLAIGETRAINHRDILDETGLPVDTIFQIITAKEDKVFKYSGVEYNYGPSVPSDNDIDVDTILFSIDEQDIDLRARYESIIGIPTGTTEAVFEVEAGVVIGSSSTGTAAMDTGSWPVGATVTVINKGFIVGAGGNGGDAGGDAGNAGGDAISMAFALTIDNFGVIGGGGGGGAALYSAGFFIFQGGGGAGNNIGLKGVGGSSGGNEAENGTLENGGLGAGSSSGGDGGDLGAAGDDVTGPVLGGAAGKAIDKNGFTLTETTTGDIRGAVS